MQLLQLTLPTPAENVALDEALLDEAEEGSANGGEVLRVWESEQPLVVIGRSSVAADEVDLGRCAELHIPVLRRPSGGAAIVAGPGCLMYAVVLSYERRPQLRWLDTAHHFVLEQVATALRSQLTHVVHAGVSDLAWHDRKISGNSVRCKRNYFLYHGTLLYNFPLELVAACLRTAPRQPAYRRQRRHDQFVTNAPVDRESFIRALARQWDVAGERRDWPRAGVEQLVRERYGRDDWNFRR